MFLLVTCIVTNHELVESYVAYPPDKSTEHAIVIFPDVIGHKFINAQLYGSTLDSLMVASITLLWKLNSQREAHVSFTLQDRRSIRR